MEKLRLILLTMHINLKKSFLVIAAHADDEVLGCGGTIARLTQEKYPVHILLMADGVSSRLNNPQAVDTKNIAIRTEAAVAANKILGSTSLIQLALPDNRMDGLELLEVIKKVEEVIAHCQPTTVITHHAGDVNIDHRIVHDAVIAACRPQPGFVVRELLFFEVPSSTEWRPPASSAMFNPNWFVDITGTLDLKLKALQSYKDELREFPHPRSPKAVNALAQWRGASVGVPALRLLFWEEN